MTGRVTSQVLLLRRGQGVGEAAAYPGSVITDTCTYVVAALDTGAISTTYLCVFSAPICNGNRGGAGGVSPRYCTRAAAR
jgi:hypothetical protein